MRPARRRPPSQARTERHLRLPGDAQRLLGVIVDRDEVIVVARGLHGSTPPAASIVTPAAASIRFSRRIGKAALVVRKPRYSPSSKASGGALKRRAVDSVKTVGLDAVAGGCSLPGQGYRATPARDIRPVLLQPGVQRQKVRKRRQVMRRHTIAEQFGERPGFARGERNEFELRLPLEPPHAGNCTRPCRLCQQTRWMGGRGSWEPLAREKMVGATGFEPATP
jgi:hypothetical protein